MLLLAVHSISEPSAKVPFCVLSLLDAVKKREVPSELRCRQIFPTAGTKATSLWDAPDQESLQNWLDEFMVADCNSEVFQVQEDFAFGISAELTRVRATERVTANTKATAAAMQEKTRNAAADAQLRMGEIDAKLKVSEHAAAAMKSARESSSAAAKRTAEVFGKVGQSAQSSYSKALENERIAAAATAINTNVSAGWKTLSAGFGSLVRGQNTAQGADSQSSSPKVHVPPTNSGSRLSRESGPEAGVPQAAEKNSKSQPGQDGSLFTLDDLDEAGSGPHSAKPSGK